MHVGRMEATKRVGIKYLCTKLLALTVPSGMTKVLVLRVTEHITLELGEKYIFQETAQDFKMVSLNLNYCFLKLCINNNNLKSPTNHR